MVEQFDIWVHSLGSLGFLVLGLASIIEYVFPPFPGDTILVIGGMYAVRGEQPWLLVFAAVTAGSLVGAVIDYGFGRYIASRIEQRPEEKLPFGLSRARIETLQAKMRAKGSLVIALNRFLPGVRSLLFVAAGVARMSLSRVMLWGAVSAIGWNLLLIGAGIAVGGNAEQLEQLLVNYQKIFGAALGLLGLLLLVRFFQKKRRKPAVK